MTCRRLAISSLDDFVYGRSPKPVRCGFDLAIGAGLVLPEINFTLPAIEVTEGNWPQIVLEYNEIARDILRRAVALELPGILLEFELLPAMTARPEWGAEITALLRRHLAEAHAKHGLKCALRVTPTDIRDQGRPPLLRRGAAWESLNRSFELCIDAGADILSIESVGGKEVHDEALLYGDLRGIVFALGVLAPRDTAWLWDRITSLCRASGCCLPGGDTACGFANTAMQLAHQKMLPETLAALDRAIAAIRSLVAFEHGAVGPSKDCAYEGPILKAITGCPISMEGKSASCAHFSPVGNVAAAVCDLWSNESVQNVRLLSGSAPAAYTELLAYDCRLMNAAAESGHAVLFRDWLARSDEQLSPQAAILTPAAALRIAQAIVDAGDSDYRRSIAAGQAAVRELRDRLAAGALRMLPREREYLARFEAELDSLPASEAELEREMVAAYGHRFTLESY